MWDPKVGSTGWDEFCTAIDKSFVPWDAPEVLSYDEDAGLVTVTENLKVPLPVYNYAQYIKAVSNISEKLSMRC